MTALRDDMTLAEAQAEAERRWPGARLKDATAESDIRHGTWPVYILNQYPGGYYFAGTPVGCLDQAIAAEARRHSPRVAARIELHRMLNEGVFPGHHSSHGAVHDLLEAAWQDLSQAEKDEYKKKGRP